MISAFQSSFVQPLLHSPGGTCRARAFHDDSCSSSFLGYCWQMHSLRTQSVVAYYIISFVLFVAAVLFECSLLKKGPARSREC